MQKLIILLFIASTSSNFVCNVHKRPDDWILLEKANLSELKRDSAKVTYQNADITFYGPGSLLLTTTISFGFFMKIENHSNNDVKIPRNLFQLISQNPELKFDVKKYNYSDSILVGALSKIDGESLVFQSIENFSEKKYKEVLKKDTLALMFNGQKLYNLVGKNY
ncbi:hypothetical protein [Niabella hirudinis]|uniref:hypothetical protein n=1 Tax=Niabella hirudinis TaxID=1285929 RepID=UPI003EB711E6